MTLFRLVVTLQLILMLPALLFFIATPPTVYTGVLLVMLAPVALVTGIYALWQAAKYSDRRQLAATSALASLICLLSPYAMQALNLPPLPTIALVGLAVLVCVVALIAVLGKPNRWQTKGAFGSRNFNIGLLLAELVFIVLLWVPFIAYLATDPEERKTMHTLASSALIYYTIVAIPAALVSLFGLLYAPIGLFKGAGNRLIHVGQLIATLALIGSLGLAAFVVMIASVNPG